jgi:hypothetical protein
MSDSQIFYVGLFVSFLVCYTLGLLRTVDEGNTESEMNQLKTRKQSSEDPL